MGATIVKVIDAKDGVRRAVIGERPDGTFQVEVQRQVAGEGEYEPRAYWTRIAGETSLTDTLDRAIAVALDALGEAVDRES